MVAKLSVTGQAELKALGARLKEAGDKGLTRELRKGLRAAAGPAVRDTQHAVRTLPVRGARGGGTFSRAAHHRGKQRPKGGFGLRATIAQATKAETKISGSARVVIRTFARFLPESQRRLPRYLDRQKGWRHPVFGDRENWVAQYGKPWFAATLKKHGPKVRGECLDAMRRVAEQITKG